MKDETDGYFALCKDLKNEASAFKISAVSME